MGGEVVGKGGEGVGGVGACRGWVSLIHLSRVEVIHLSWTEVVHLSEGETDLPVRG